MQELCRCDALLQAAAGCYAAGAALRARRERYKRFTFGDQWGDTVTDARGRRMTELELASAKGRTPLTNNLIRKLVRTVTGRFVASLASEEPLPGELAEVARRNSLDELDARTLEEFLISGMAVQHISRECRPQGSGVWVSTVSPARFFAAPLRDPRGLDVEMVGMVHDWSLAETKARFAGGSARRAAAIAELYGSNAACGGADAITGAWADSVGRLLPGRCRVIEVWTLEGRELLQCHDPATAAYFTALPSQLPRLRDMNRRRTRRGEQPARIKWSMDTVWHGRWLTEGGHLLGERVAGCHPFAFRFYPLLDGEVHSFVEDVIDQQKYVNRLITQVDNMMSTSAKGVLLFPQDELGDGMNWADVSREWTSYDGVIPYNPRPGSGGPRQVITNAAAGGAYELLALEMKMLEDVSGVTGALQGRDAQGSGSSARLYDAQVRQGAESLADVLATFHSFRHDRTRLLAAL